jgi:cobaltochelatase CobT
MTLALAIDGFHLIAVFAICAGLFWFFLLRKPVPEGLIKKPYMVYTSEFDRVVRGEDVEDQLISFSPDVSNGHFDLTNENWKAQIEASKTLLSSSSDFAFEKETINNAAILILIDQSGSMEGQPMAWAAAEIRKLTDQLSFAGATVEVAGFTTAGWQGGFARQKWLANHSPKRPGRLCALLHVVYKSFDEAEWNEQSFNAMLNPNILRENVDGEAIIWAEDRLKKQAEDRRVLIIISDGAPVDDSTLMENGDSYLWQHCVNVVLDVETRNEIELIAIGLDHRVNEIYARYVMTKVGDNLSKLVSDLL